jgi:glycosyltransferase involved in cell wall biosynthesis
LAQISLLMVGTIEPRKGHEAALAAMETFWDEGSEVALIIVGKEGWRSRDLVRRLRGHPQRNRRLFWLERTSDETLQRLYHQSSALLAASFAEGFGLPLIEAAHYGLPIIARDIPVFHEVAGDFAFYFPNTDSAALADSLRHWLQLYAGGKAPQSKGMPYLTWAQSTQQLLDVLIANRWYIVWMNNEVTKNNGG